jgi:hypothetical protein
VLALAESTAPTCGASRLVAIDGPAGAGKSTLTARLQDLLAGRSCSVVHLEDLYPGWSGLLQLEQIVDPMVRELATGRATSFVAHDWSRDQSGESQMVQPADWILLEGVGAGSRRWGELITTLVWVEHEDALQRAIGRDGESSRSQLRKWHRDEERVFAREQTHARADLIFVSD